MTARPRPADAPRLTDAAAEALDRLYERCAALDARLKAERADSGEAAVGPPAPARPKGPTDSTTSDPVGDQPAKTAAD